MLITQAITKCQVLTLQISLFILFIVMEDILYNYLKNNLNRKGLISTLIYYALTCLYYKFNLRSYNYTNLVSRTNWTKRNKEKSWRFVVLKEMISKCIKYKTAKYFCFGTVFRKCIWIIVQGIPFSVHLRGFSLIFKDRGL